MLEANQRARGDGAQLQQTDEEERGDEHCAPHLGATRPVVAAVAHPPDHRHSHVERHHERDECRVIEPECRKVRYPGTENCAPQRA